MSAKDLDVQVEGASSTTTPRSTVTTPTAAAQTQWTRDLQRVSPIVAVPWQRQVINGIELIRHPQYNKGMAFSMEERMHLRIHGLLPPRVMSLEEQAQQVMWNMDRREDHLAKYQYLMGVADRNEKLFYYVLIRNIERLMKIVYTPTVGLACQKFGNIFSQPRGLWLSIRDRGYVKQILRHWPQKHVKAICVTDGERILGLGDLGANGMGIPIGKLALYTALAGIRPQHLLPVLLDVGTNNEELLQDPFYPGLQQRRTRGAEYDALVEEFFTAVTERFGRSTLIQFEDFGNANALRLLEKFRDRYTTFNDDIQGTASVAMAGLLASQRITGKRLSDQTYVILGAGSAGLGIAELLVRGMMQYDGTDEETARAKIWLLDSRGLIVKNRSTGGISPAKARFAHEHAETKDLLEVVKDLRADVLVGVSAQPRTFTEDIVRAMAEMHERPVVMPMSNPTSKAECTAQQALEWSDGRAVFASGSPFDPVVVAGKRIIPGQGNNAYIFPGVALGVTAVKASTVPEDVFLIAAKTLAKQVSQKDLESGLIYPPLSKIRQVSFAIACDVGEYLFEQGLATEMRPYDIKDLIRRDLYQYSSHEVYSGVEDALMERYVSGDSQL
ncbi:MAG: hypothetical protein MHM6MM_004846 [Cercozoa sp. M6MM]